MSDFGDLWSLPPADDDAPSSSTPSPSASSVSKKGAKSNDSNAAPRASRATDALTQAYPNGNGNASDVEMKEDSTSRASRYRLRWVSKVSRTVAFDRVVPLREEEVRVGRQREHVDFFIDSSRTDRMISRVHAKLTCKDPGKPCEQWTISDNGSVNGIHVNGKRIGKPRGFGKATLSPGDTVQFGTGTLSTSEFVFRFERTPPRQAPDDAFGEDSSTDEEGGGLASEAAARSPHREDMSDDNDDGRSSNSLERRKRTRSLSLDDSDYGDDSQASDRPTKLARTSSTDEGKQDAANGDTAMESSSSSNNRASILEIERLKKEAELERLRLQMQIAELERDKLRLENERMQRKSSAQSQIDKTINKESSMSSPSSSASPSSASSPSPSSSSSSASSSNRKSTASRNDISDSEEKAVEPWRCDVCTMENTTFYKECATCGFWACTVCFFKRNKPDASECERCTIEKPDPKMKCKHCGEKMREIELQDHLLAHEHERAAKEAADVKESADAKKSESAEGSSSLDPPLLTRTASAIPCEVCRKEFSFMEYEGHLRTHRKPVAAPISDSASEAAIPCDICGENFPLACYQDHFEEHKEQRKLKAAKDTIPVNSNVGMACKVIEILRAIPEDMTGGGSCVNYDLTLAFVECYRKMVKNRGFKLAKPQIVYHWTNEKNFRLIEENNLKVPDGRAIMHATDDGFYGRGIYTSPDPTYATGYGHGAKKTFACLALIGKKYFASYSRDRGKPLRKGFDIHVSNDRSNKEWVFFDSAQLLPCFLAEPRHMDELKQILEELGDFLETSEKDRQKAEKASART